MYRKAARSRSSAESLTVSPFPFVTASSFSSPNQMAAIGHWAAQCGSLPSRAMAAQKSHFSAVPTRRGYPHSGEYPRASAAGGFSGRLQLNTRAEKGQAAMQNRQPMQRSLSISTIPVSYTHLRAHETRHDLVCRLLLE